jgi:hypothetical protein
MRLVNITLISKSKTQKARRIHSKKMVLYGTSKNGSVDVEKLPNVSKESKKELKKSTKL